VGTRIWREAHVREHAYIGEACSIGKGVYIDKYVHIGSRVKIQNHVSLFEGVTLEDGVFVGPHVCFTNDMFPRAIPLDGRPKGADDPAPFLWRIRIEETDQLLGKCEDHFTRAKSLNKEISASTTSVSSQIMW
jgi:NDP-sugar pyrophosphorylase family protein